MGDYGMTSPKPGPIKEPSTSTVAGLSSGSLGDAMGDEDDWFAAEGNMSKGELGGDNNPEPGKFATDGNPPPQSVMSDEYDWQGDKPLYAVEGNCSREELKSYFRGGSDALGMDGRSGGS